MNIQQLEKLLHHQTLFSSQDIKLVDKTFRRNTLTDRVKQGKILRIKRGRYLFASYQYTIGIFPYVSNKILSPSYLSLERALSYYGLIPEGVSITTNITTKKTQTYNTPLGMIKYQHVHPSLFRGYEEILEGDFRYFIASPEKTLLDYLYLHPEMNSFDAFDERRIDISLLQELREREVFLSYMKKYTNKQLQKRATLFLKRIDIG